VLDDTSHGNIETRRYGKVIVFQVPWFDLPWFDLGLTAIDGGSDGPAVPGGQGSQGRGFVFQVPWFDLGLTAIDVGSDGPAVPGGQGSQGRGFVFQVPWFDLGLTAIDGGSDVPVVPGWHGSQGTGRWRCRRWRLLVTRRRRICGRFNMCWGWRNRILIGWGGLGGFNERHR
jgi:hypothetical protein